MSDRAQQEAVSQLRKDAGVFRPGFYRGRVEDIDDPDRLGRVKVRVWAIHGDEHRTPTTALSWAEIAEQGGGGYDYGSFNPPPVGSAVWVGFEEGHQDFPVVFGTFRGVPQRNDENPNIMLTKDNKPVVEKPWLPPDEDTETPKDVFDGVHNGDPHPTRRVWHKSYKGHTIVVEDGDGKEFLKIVDRSGQVIEMYCPVAVEASQGNASQRGARDAARGDQLPHAIMRDRRALIRLRDLSGQEVVLDAADQNERITIRSKSRTGTGTNILEMRSGKGKESIELKDSGGNRVFMDPNSQQPIKIEDSAGNKIIFDKQAGKIQIIGAKKSEEVVPQKSLTVAGKKESSIQGDEVKKIQGNKKTDIVNDLALGVLGNTNISCGGQVEVVITNQVLGTIPTPGNGLKINLAQLLGCDFELSNLMGDMTMSTKVGDWTIETLLGNIDVTTTKGNVQVGTLLGDATFGTNLGNVLVQTSMGTATLNGTTSHVGETLAAVHPILRGELANAAIIAKNTALDALAATIVSTLTPFLVLAVPMNIPAIPASVGLLIPGTGQTLFAALTAILAYFTARPIADATEATALAAALSPKRFVD